MFAEIYPWHSLTSITSADTSDLDTIFLVLGHKRFNPKMRVSMSRNEPPTSLLLIFHCKSGTMPHLVRLRHQQTQTGGAKYSSTGGSKRERKRVITLPSRKSPPTSVWLLACSSIHCQCAIAACCGLCDCCSFSATCTKGSVDAADVQLMGRWSCLMPCICFLTLPNRTYSRHSTTLQCTSMQEETSKTCQILQ
jgi:hypothetical protein